MYEKFHFRNFRMIRFQVNPTGICSFSGLSGLSRRDFERQQVPLGTFS